MSAQRYSDWAAQERMGRGRCPECGGLPERHVSDNRFWLPRPCNLLERGVVDRIAQYEEDSRRRTYDARDA